MSGERQFYALADTEQGKERGAFPITLAQAPALNKQGFGIFWTVQSFKGPRSKENLFKINSWAIDMDGGNKDEQLEIIRRHIYPSLVIETKNGFHVYFHAKDATLENFEAIVSDRLVPAFNADPRAKDISRILRVPEFHHMKDPKDPFLVRVVWEYPVSYTEEQMFFNFRLTEEKETESQVKQELRNAFRADGDTIWEKIYSLDCEIALQRLSGTEAVSFERFTFRRVSNGNLNILVNGKSTSCWIDSNKRIGSHTKGGPTIWQWVNWYYGNHKKTYRFIREMFGELWS